MLCTRDGCGEACQSEGGRRKGQARGLCGSLSLVSVLMPRTRRRRESQQLAGGPSGGRNQSPRWVPRCEEPVSGQQPRWLPLPPTVHTGPGRMLASFLAAPLGQVCPVPVWLRALRVCTEPRHPVHVGSCSSSSSGSVRSHQCLRAPLPGWPPPSLCRLPGWRSHADPSQALPCSLSYPTCCPG